MCFDRLEKQEQKRWLYRGILLTERFPSFGCEGNNQRESVCVADAVSLL